MTPPAFELIHRDCIEWMNEQPEKSIHAVVTSPPYNLNIGYGEYKDNHPYADYLKWMRLVSSALKRVLTDDGQVFVNMGYSNAQPWTAMDVAQVFRNDWILQNQFTWVKHILLHQQTYGIYKPIAGNRFVSPTTESIFHFTKTGNVSVDRRAIGHANHTHATYPELYTEGRHIAILRRKAAKKLGYSTWVDFKTKATPTHQKDFDALMEEYKRTQPWNPDKKKCIGNAWYIPYTPVSKLASELGTEGLGDSTSGRGGHPATFPEQLPTMCLKFSGIPTGSVVYDPFSGTGTTVLAAVKLGMHGIGTDVDAKYLKFATRRVEMWQNDNNALPFIDSDTHL